jgi:hypothetical protein
MRKYLLCVVALWAAVALVQCAARDATAPRAPLPLDPITPAESEAAPRIAQSHSGVREAVGEGARLIYVRSIAPKRTANDDEPRGRHADIVLISASNEAGVRVLVDLVAGSVVDFVRLPQAQVPLGPGDIEEALRIALEHDAVRQLLGARASGFRVLTGPIGPHNANTDFVEGLRHVGAAPDDPCFRNRCVYLLFNSGGRLILQDREILVNLNTRQVRVSPARGGG